jgi:hypothetical protein
MKKRRLVQMRTKKTNIFFIVKVENKNDYSLFYDYAAGDQMSVADKFGEIKSQNATGFLASLEIVSVRGMETGIHTRDNKVLLSIPKGQTITQECKFSYKKDEKPILYFTFTKTLKKLDQYDVTVSEALINGDWKSSCQTNPISLSFSREPNGERVVKQVINGKITIWKFVSGNTYAKFGDVNSTLSYDGADNTIIYANSDGVNCIYSKIK